MYQDLRKLHYIKLFLNFEQGKIFPTSFNLSPLDYWSSLFEIEKKALRRQIQIIQNAAARFVLGVTWKTSSSNKFLKKTLSSKKRNDFYLHNFNSKS